MNFGPPKRTMLQSILSGSYTPYEVREFVRLCYALALPLIRKRIIQGKINLEVLGLRQVDLVYDCIADLFIRDSDGHFTEIEGFFKKEISDFDLCSDALLFDTLRKVVFRKVVVNLIRVHSLADPAFGKILHNLDVALTRSRHFEKFVRFGDSMLACCDAELLLHLPTPPLEYLREQLSRVVLIHDPMPTILGKLRDLLVHQHDFQRTVYQFWVAMLVKETYALGMEGEAETEPSSFRTLEEEEVAIWIKEVLADIRRQLQVSYVDKGKMTDGLFETYLCTADEILRDWALEGTDHAKPFFEYLNSRMPQLTREEYISRHKSILEYVVRLSRQRLASRIRPGESAE
jgi:hypothetical protein